MISVSVIFILLWLIPPDMKSKKIPVAMLVFVGILAIVLRVIFTLCHITELSLVQMVMALLPGCVFLVLSFVTGEQVGYGDGVVLLILGILYPFWRLMMVLGTALSLTSFFSIMILLLRKGNRYTKLPFLPFLGVGVIMEWILEMK